MAYYLLFIFVLDYGNDVRQKANLSDFLFEFKMSGKVVETTCNINNSFDPGTANEGTVQWWSQKFSRGDENLEDKEHDGRPSKLTTTDWELSRKLVHVQLLEKLLKNSASTIL